MSHHSSNPSCPSDSVHATASWRTSALSLTKPDKETIRRLFQGPSRMILSDDRRTLPRPSTLFDTLWDYSLEYGVLNLRRIFTLSSIKPDNPVILQRSFRGYGCIPSRLADLHIETPAMLLYGLNDIFGTSYTFASTPYLKALLDYCIGEHFDLGMAYGLLRPYWFSSKFYLRSLLSDLHSREYKDSERRARAVNEKFVVDRRIPPRRVWDLHSNRVMPFWMLPSSIQDSWDLANTRDSRTAGRHPRVKEIVAVSHAWMSPTRRDNMTTPINGKTWPVPVPNDTSLDDLRIELLNSSTAEYAWVDALCLRQESDWPEETNRHEEWKIDVPTIGTIYETCESVVFYLSGLGRQLEPHGLEDQFHWCNRAWTLQEWCCAVKLDISHHRVGGLTKTTPDFNLFNTFDKSTNSFARALKEKIPAHSHWATRNFRSAVFLMCKRSAHRELDRIAGLAYLACDGVQPVFDETQDVEDAWVSFVSCIKPMARAELFFLFPTTGSGKAKWMPAWEQLLEWVEDIDGPAILESESIHHEYCPRASEQPSATLRRGSTQKAEASYTSKPGCGSEDYSCKAVCIPSCHLSRFDSLETVSGRSIRQTTVTFQIPQNDSATVFRLVAYHDYPVPIDGTYCLIPSVGNFGNLCRYWVVGYLDDKERFHKITVLETDRRHNKNRWSILHALGLRLPDEEHDTWKKGTENSAWVRRVKLA